jgi:hypothetical protein
MIKLILILLLSSAAMSAYDWTVVKQMMDLYQYSGAYPGAVLRVANSTHNLFTYEVGHFTKDSQVPFTQ